MLSEAPAQARLLEDSARGRDFVLATQFLFSRFVPTSHTYCTWMAKGRRGSFTVLHGVAWLNDFNRSHRTEPLGPLRHHIPPEELCPRPRSGHFPGRRCAAVLFPRLRSGVVHDPWRRLSLLAQFSF